MEFYINFCVCARVRASCLRHQSPSLSPEATWTREPALSLVPSTEHRHPLYTTTSPHGILEPPPHWLTNTNWFLSRPLATLLAGNCFLSLQLKGRLALKLQTVPMAKGGSFSPAVSWDPGITAAPLVNLWKRENRSCMGEGSDTELVQYLACVCAASCLAALRHHIPRGEPVPSALPSMRAGPAAAQNTAKIPAIAHGFYHWEALLRT